MSVSVRPIDRDSQHTHSLCISISAPRTAALSHPPTRCVLKLPVQSNHKSFDEYISSSAKFWWWHIYPQNARRNKKTHTWGQIHISSWCKIITALTGLSSPHVILSSLQFLIWFDIWIRWCDVHIFTGEASLCLLSHRDTTGDVMTLAPCSTESPNKRSPAPAPRKICNINLLISRSAGICILGLVWWMNHFLSSRSQNTLCPKAGLWRTSNTERDVKGGENIDTVLSWIYESPLQGETCSAKEKWIHVGCLQRFFLRIDASLQTLFQEKWHFNLI